MPELPEVETIRRELAPELTGRVVTGVTVHKSDIVLPPDDPVSFRSRVTGRRIDSVTRRAKYLLLGLDDGPVVQVQLRMSGRFALGALLPDPSEFRHVAAEIHLDDGRTLFYDDMRRLGGFRLLNHEVWASESERIGPEPLADSFRARDLEGILARTRAPVKTAIMDQHRLAGVGNIYASEALHRARIDPRRAGRDLSRSEVGRLHRAVRAVLREALDAAGTTFRNYRAINGRSGRFQSSLRVYGRAGEPCPRCDTAVWRIVQAGRSTFFCPGCQT